MFSILTKKTRQGHEFWVAISHVAKIIRSMKVMESWIRSDFFDNVDASSMCVCVYCYCFTAKYLVMSDNIMNIGDDNNHMTCTIQQSQ